MTKKTTRSSLCNPVMFSAVMQDEEIFRGLLARILPDREIRSLRFRDNTPEDFIKESEVFLQTEHSVIINPYAKSVRFDVLFAEEDVWYDVEVQATDTRELPQRSRYYHAVAAVDSLAKGQAYKELRPGYVIFICLFDLFGQNEPVYSFQMFDEKNRLHLGDGQVTMFLNSTCSKDDIPCELKNLFRYLEEDTVAEADPWLMRLQNAVKVMENEKEVRSRMTLYDEWVRTAVAFEKCKKDLKEADAKIEKLEAECQQAETKHLQAETDRQRFESLLKCLLTQGRTEDMKRALEDANYRAQLFEKYEI